MDLLKKYGVLLGYKLDINKTQIITFNYNPPEDIRRKYKLNWELESIRYLGVNLSKNITKLFDFNYGPLNTKIKPDIFRWNTILFLSLSSGIESIRINVLP